MNHSAHDCVIVGAGIAGLIAGTELQKSGWDVALLDKGRGVGGRMATRRNGDATFDHGAQYFTVRDPKFQAIVDTWLEKGVLFKWSSGFLSSDGDVSNGNNPRYCGVDGMTSLPKALAADLNVQLSTQVTRIDFLAGQWHLTAIDVATQKVHTFVSKALLMTPPAEQTLTLMRSGNVILNQQLIFALETIQFNPCFALMVVLDRPTKIPEPGGVFMPGEPISWMSDNQQKGISDVPAVTIHAGPEFTREHYETSPDEVARLLIDAAYDYLGEAEVVRFQVQRWRYSHPSVMHPEQTLFTTEPASLAFAGDAFNGARVEGAVLSGMAAAEVLLNEI